MANSDNDQPKIIIQRPRMPGHVAMFVSLSIIILAFFILLNAFSTADEERKREALKSIHLEFVGIFGEPERSLSLLEQSGEELEDVKGTASGRGEELLFEIISANYNKFSSLKKFGETSGLGGTIGVVVSQRGMVVTIGEKLTFGSGDDQLTALGRRFIGRLVEIVRPYRNRILVEGHTDNNPLGAGGRFASNWELSQARAMSVLRFMNQAGIDPDRLSAAGASEFRPLVENDTPEHRAMNRRVEIIIKHPRLSPPPKGS